MGIHEWLDVAGWLVLLAVTVVSVLLGARLARHDAERKEIQDHGSKLSYIEGLLKGAGIWK